MCEFYEQHKEENPLDFQIVFVSSDRDPASFSNYFGSMPWLALPFEDRMRKESISSKFGIRGIPGLVVLDSISGQVLSQTRARQEVSQCRGDTNAVVANWLNNLPVDSVELVEMCKMTYLESQEQNDGEVDGDSENHFLVRQNAIPPKTNVSATPLILISVNCPSHYGLFAKFCYYLHNRKNQLTQQVVSRRFSRNLYPLGKIQQPPPQRRFKHLLTNKHLQVKLQNLGKALMDLGRQLHFLVAWYVLISTNFIVISCIRFAMMLTHVRN